MTDRRPFTPADDAYIVRAVADGRTYRQMAQILGRSAASIEGRLRNIRAERRLRAACFRGAGGSEINENW